MIEKQIDIRIIACFVASRRAEQIEVLNAELLELGFVFLKLSDGKVTSYS
jgi:hypothetical protein